MRVTLLHAVDNSVANVSYLKSPSFADSMLVQKNVDFPLRPCILPKKRTGSRSAAPEPGLISCKSHARLGGPLLGLFMTSISSTLYICQRVSVKSVSVSRV